MTPSESPGPKIEEVGSNRVHVSFTEKELHCFEISIGCNAKFSIFWMAAMAIRGD